MCLVRFSLQEQKRVAAQAQADLAVANQKQMEELVRLIYGFLSNDLPKQLEATVLQQTGSLATQLSETSRASLASELSKALEQHGAMGGSAPSQEALQAAVVEQVVPALQEPLKVTSRAPEQPPLLLQIRLGSLCSCSTESTVADAVCSAGGDGAVLPVYAFARV